MAAPPQILYREVIFHPSEADRIAEKISDLIRKFQAEKGNFDDLIRNLDINWEGHQKEKFISTITPYHRKGNNLLEYLQRQLTFYKNLQVTRRESYTNPAWEVYQRGKK
jgi:uncharacterized protein YukE